MIRKNLVVFFIPFILFAGEVRKDYYFSIPEIKDSVVYLKGCRTIRDPFAPSVAVKPIKLILPYGQKAVSFSVTYDMPVELNGEYGIQPFRPGGRLSGTPPKDYYTRKSILYSKNEFYPSQVRSGKFYTQYKNGNAIFVTIVNPVRYNPVSKKIQYHKRVSIAVNTEPVRVSGYKCTPFIKDQLRQLVDNPEMVSGLPFSKQGANDYEYLIVTTDALKSSFDTFIAFNKRRCLRAKVQTIDYIKANVTGTDDAEKLRTYIKQEYTNFNIVYVLLAGDDDNGNPDDIPHRGMRASAYDYGTDFYDDTDIPADMYYSCLDGTWKNGGSSYYGEYGCEDIGWEVYAARFPADNATELNNIINKTIKYSEQPVVNEVKNNLFAGEYMWGPPSHPIACYGKDLLEQLIGTCTANSYTTVGFPTWNASKFYDKEATWSSTSFLTAVNDNKITWINHVGHSNDAYVFKHTTSVVTNTNYTNNGTNANFFIAYTQSCYPGSFDNKQISGSYTANDCIAEQFTCGISNGAVAFLACSRYSWGDDGTISADGTDGSNQRLQRYFHDAIFNKKIHHLEMMNAYSKEVNADIILDPSINQDSTYFGQLKWAAYNLNILGDPALSVWTNTPDSLHPVYDTLLIDSSFEMQTPSYTWVALATQSDSIICTQLTDSAGNCVIANQEMSSYVGANQGGRLNVFVKAHNYFPYKGSMRIGPVDSVNITSHPTPDTVVAGGVAQFSVTVTGTKLTYQWQRNDPAWKNVSSGGNSADYSFTTAAGDNGVWFRCIVSSGAKAETSDSARLTLAGITVSSPNGTELWERGKQYSIAWSDNISENVKIELLNGGVLHSTIAASIPSLSPYTWTISDTITHGSGYKIKITSVTNALITDESNTNFTIYQPITIINNPARDSALVGDTAEFSVSATGYNLAYQWQRNNGGWHNVTPGGTGPQYKLSAASGDNGVFFRCILSSNPLLDTTDSAMLIIVSKPVVPDQFSSDTVITLNDSLTLTGSATAVPPPSYEWFFIKPGSPTPVSKGAGASLSVPNAAKADLGIYYFVASNKYGSTSSDSLFLHVMSPVQIQVDLPAEYTVVNGGEAVFSIEAQGDDTIKYQWYENGSLMSGQTASSLKISPIDSATHNGKKYLCKVWNTFLGVIVGRDSSTESTIKVSSLYNPFKIKAERHTTTKVRIKLWSDVNISGFPSTSSPNPWADSLWVLYKTKGYATDTAGVAIKRYSIDKLKQAATANDSLKDTLTVGLLQAPHDSCYWFNYSVLWHVPGGADELLKPFTSAGKVFMFDTTPSQNPLSVSGNYFDKTDSARMIIDNISLLNTNTDSLAVFQCSRYADFNPLLFDSALAVSVLLAAGNKDTLIVHKLGTLPIETDTAYYRWYIVGKNKVASVKKTSKVVIGWDRPVYTGNLYCDTTNRPDQVKLSWDSPVAGTDSIRIWWDTKRIPLVNNVNLPLSQAFKVSTSVIKDTLDNLNPATMYYFGLQIFKDMMWSCVTNNSSDSVTTPKADTLLMVRNTMSVDTSWFDTATNELCIKWSVDTAGLTSDSTLLQMGCSYSIDSIYFKTTIPSQWPDITGLTDTFTIALGPDIVFNTTYYSGLWMRKKKIGGSVGTASGPGDSVKAAIKTPSFFTWQTVTLSSNKPDTVYIYNGKIIIHSITPFGYTDTIRSYYRQKPLPDGMSEVSGTGFRFCKKNPQVPDFKIGIQYKLSKSSIKKDNVNIYKDANGPLDVLYASQAEDSIVWATIAGADISSPFLALADTLRPTISFEGTTTDTAKVLSPDSSVATQFKVSDNISNAKWQLLYGRGDMGYAYGLNGSLDSCLEVVNTIIPSSENVVSMAYGLRAIFIVTDGVYTDTINVSRRVKTSNSDVITAASMEWVPLRATSSLVDSTIQTVLSMFKNEQGVWEYDRTKFLAARWYDTTGGFGSDVIEYSDALQENFSLIPGRIVWLKTKELQVINFGEGVTTSLKQPHGITLQGRSWNDMSLPYKFSIKIKDILAATGNRSDSLVFYRWEKSDSTYVAVPLYIPALDSASGKLDTLKLICKPGSDAYTIYSYSSVPIALTIPPIPLALSSCTRTVRSEQQQKNFWDISLLWKKANKRFVNQVRCGYSNNGAGEMTVGPLPPSFGKVGAGIADGRGGIGGYAVSHSMKNSGLSYEIVFYNNSAMAEELEYGLGSLEALPEGFVARIYNPSSAAYEDAMKEMCTVTLQKNSSARRWVVIGNENYFNGFLKNNIVSSFSLLGTYPNPFRGRINIRYLVPWQGIKKIQFRIFDLRGCVVWEKELSKDIIPGLNTITWNANGKSGQRIASGVYLLQVKVLKNGAKGYEVFQRKLTCIY